MKKYQVILAFLLIILIAGGAFATLGVLDIRSKQQNPSGEGEKPSENSASHNSYVDEYEQYNNITLPLLKTDFEDVFFTLNRNTGAVSFYEGGNGALTPLDETGSFKVTVPASSQELPAEIHYVERDGHTFGVGLYTNALYSGAYLYEYAFFKVSDMFPQSSAAAGSLLLTVDVDATRMFTDDKVYSENYILSPDKTTAKYYLSEDQRTVDTSARMRTDYKMFTDDILAADQAQGRTVLFFSSRYYEMFDNAGKVDIFTSGGTGTNTDNGREVLDVYTLHFWRSEGDLFFFRRAEGGFTLNVKYGSTGVEDTLLTFTGDLEKDYVVDGHFLFNKATGELTNVLTSEKHYVDYGLFGAEGTFTVDSCAISENGEWAVLRGMDAEKNAICGFVRISTGKVVAYKDETFNYVAGMHVMNDGTILLSMAASNDPANTTYYQLIAKGE